MLVETTPITLSDGIKRELLYTMMAFKLIKKETGKSLMKDGPAYFQDIDEEHLPYLVWAGLTDKKKITPDDVANLITPGMLQEVLTTTFQAMTASMPKIAKNDQTELETEVPTTQTAN